MNFDFRSDEEFEEKTDTELLTMARNDGDFLSQTRAVAVLGRRAGENEEALRTVVEVSKSERGKRKLLEIELRWYGVAGLTHAGTDATRQAVVDVMSDWTEEEQESCRSYLALSDLDVP
jgi:hypothetical protein